MFGNIIFTICLVKYFMILKPFNHFIIVLILSLKQRNFTNICCLQHYFMRFIFRQCIRLSTLSSQSWLQFSFTLCFLLWLTVYFVYTKTIFSHFIRSFYCLCLVLRVVWLWIGLNGCLVRGLFFINFWFWL